MVETGGGGAEGGVDLVLRRPGKNGSEKFFFQCKQWRAFKVGVGVVREPWCGGLPSAGRMPGRSSGAARAIRPAVAPGP